MHLPLPAALATVPEDAARRFTELFAHGSLSVEIFVPKDRDTQEPHRCDEVYVVARGKSTFILGKRTFQVAAGDVLFVPAGEPHRFESFTPDFATWVLFFGPDGGERGTGAAPDRPRH